MTEGITNVNIPSVQLLIGMGVPLWRIPQIRATFVGVDARMDVEQFDMEATPQRLPDAHVVAVSARPARGRGVWPRLAFLLGGIEAGRGWLLAAAAVQ